MSEFVQTMKNWRRMCQHMSDMFGDSSCDRCPLVGCAAIYEDDGEMDYADVKNKVDAWAAEHPEPVYPTWGEWLQRMYNSMNYAGIFITPIPADIAQKLGLQTKEG